MRLDQCKAILFLIIYICLYFVNINQIKKFVRGEGGYLIMNDGTQITIARARREEFFSLFEML